MPKITFHSNRIYNSTILDTAPEVTKKNIPSWFVESSRYWFPENKDSLSFKACPALIDAFVTGYV